MWKWAYWITWSERWNFSSRLKVFGSSPPVSSSFYDWLKGDKLIITTYILKCVWFLLYVCYFINFWFFSLILKFYFWAIKSYLRSNWFHILKKKWDWKRGNQNEKHDKYTITQTIQLWFLEIVLISFWYKDFFFVLLFFGLWLRKEREKVIEFKQ